MKKKILPSVTMVIFLLILSITANAQESQQKKLHLVIEENGAVTMDTSVVFNKYLSEKEVQEIINGITGETSHPCPDHQKRVMHCDTIVHTYKHADDGELDSLLEASGRTLKHIQFDSCSHVSGKDGSFVIYTEKVEAEEGSGENEETEIVLMHKSTGEEPVIVEEGSDIYIIKKGHGNKHLKVIAECNADTLAKKKIKEIKIIEMEDDDTDLPKDAVEKKEVKKIIITEEGEKAEKTIIIESPEKTVKSKEEQK